MPKLLLHDARVIFNQNDESPRRTPNEGWAIGNVYEADGQTVAILSERFKADGSYDDGPDDRYYFSLTNGIEQAFTALRQGHQRQFDVLIHYTPERIRPGRNKPDPLDRAVCALVTLDWNDTVGHYRQRAGLHPWTSLGHQAFEALLGMSPSMIPLD